MLDRGGQARLLLEARPKGGVVRDVREDHLDRDPAVEPLLVGPVDDAHAAPTDDPFQAYARDDDPGAGILRAHRRRP